MGASLTAETRGSGGSAHASQLRAALIVTELALSLVLLAGAGLLIVSFRNVINVSPGFESAQLVTAPITLPSSRYGTHARATAFFGDACSASSANSSATAASPFWR